MRLKANKYHAVKTTVNGYTFDSLAEARRYQELYLMVKSKDITHLQVHSPMRVTINGENLFSYTPDFTYLDLRTKKTVYEDVKGVITPVFALKKKVIEALDPHVRITVIRMERRARRK